MMPSRDAVARTVPFAVFIASLMLSSFHPADWLIVGRALPVVFVLAYFWPTYVELTLPVRPPWTHWLAAIVVGLAVFALWITLDRGWAVMSESSSGFDPTRNGHIDWPLALTRLAGLGLVVPVMEELFWRSFLLRWLVRQDFLGVEPRRVHLRAFLVSTAIFAVEHNQWLAGAIAGAAYAWLYMRSGNLWVTVVAHAVTNCTLGLWIISTENWQFW
jgi:CAAX prenyl protease-like protein